MIQNDTARNSPPTNLKMSYKATAFSIAAIIGEQRIKKEPNDVYNKSMSNSDNDSVKEIGSVNDVDVTRQECCASRSDINEFSSPHMNTLITCTSSMMEVNCKLETRDLWKKFNKLGTEMIITKTGRRMFPTVRVSFSGIEPTSRYAVLMDITPVDKKRYRYAYHRSSWFVAGKADVPPPPRLHIHPDGIFSGEQLAKQIISFEKLKLTNNSQDKNGKIVLNSMYKYQPRIYVIKINGTTTCPPSSLDNEEYTSFAFPETVFIAVTAYQNQMITKLKIDCNPFAKGFRDSTRLCEFERDTMEGVLHSKGYQRPLTQIGCNPEMPDPLRLSPHERQKVLTNNPTATWRVVPKSHLVSSFTYASLPASFPSQIPSMSAEMTMLTSLYGSMLESHPLYNQELLLRSHLLKNVYVQSGLPIKQSLRYYPYIQNTTVKSQNQS